MAPFEEITNEDWESLLFGLVRRQYHLLVGTGINSDCIGGDGLPIPDSKGLAEQLITDFRLKTDGEDINLRRAYEGVENLRDTKSRGRTQYFKSRFSNCTPKWQELIFRLNWRRIWTLNIDDVLENASKIYNKSLATTREFYTYSWNDAFVEIDRGKDIVQIVHLHGYSLNSENLIFSIMEYLKALTTRNSWHPVFGDEYQQDPFIVIGSNLRDELDLHEFIIRGNQSQILLGRPSLIVLKEFTEFQRAECLKWGLIPVKSDAENFLRKLIPGVQKLEAKMAETITTGTTTLPLEAKTFLEQFRPLKSNKKQQVIPYGHDFYAGYEPIWADILNDLDVRFEATENIHRDIEAILKSDVDQQLYYIAGDPGTAKSVTLLRIAHNLIALGKDIYIFRGEERPSINSITWWLKHSPNTILLFDNVADFMAEIKELCYKCKENNIKLLIVAAERTRREGLIVDELEYSYLHKYKKTKLGYLTDSDISNLIDKLKKQGRLGVITPKFPGEQIEYFRKVSNRELFPAMTNLEGGQGFLNRVTKEYKSDIKKPELKQVYALTCVAHALGYSLPAAIVSSATEIPLSDIMHEVLEGQLFRIVIPDNKGLKTRHRVIASHVLEQAFTKEERFELAKNLAIHLSPHISISAIVQKSLYYRIVRELMDEQIVLRWMDVKLAQKFYEELRPFYDWDARYWEQRALAEARMDHLDKAMSFAETAILRHRDPFTLNTLGLILLRIAASSDYSGTMSHKDLYFKGVENLRESLAAGSGIFPHPFRTFFTHTLRYVDIHFKDREVEQAIIREWDWWYERAKNNRLFAHRDSYAQLEGYNISWLKLVTKNKPDE